MASPMPDITDEEWTHLNVHLTREACPWSRSGPEWEQSECGAHVAANGKQDCSMAGISGDCIWGGLSQPHADYTGVDDG